MMNLVRIWPEVVQLSLAHQLYDSLKCVRPTNKETILLSLSCKQQWDNYTNCDGIFEKIIVLNSIIIRSF